jgi:hypothetical protein
MTFLIYGDFCLPNLGHSTFNPILQLEIFTLSVTTLALDNGHPSNKS